MNHLEIDLFLTSAKLLFFSQSQLFQTQLTLANPVSFIIVLRSTVSLETVLKQALLKHSTVFRKL